MDLVLIVSEDGKLSYGYSSFQGRRASMEDFYDAKLSSINEQTVGFFGIFDGLIFSAIFCSLMYDFPWLPNYIFL